MTSQTLEQKTEKIDRREWLLVYGIYQAYKDSKDGKPNVIESGNGIKLAANSAYQAVSIFAMGLGLYELAEKIIK